MINPKLKTTILTLFLSMAINFIGGSKVFAKSPPTEDYLQPRYVPEVSRLCGNNRFDTSIAIARQKNQTGKSIIIANAYNFPDALAASSFAYSYDNASILLTDANALNSKTLKEIQTRKPKNIYLIGGPSVVSSNVEKQVKKYCSNVSRIYGKNRYQTAVKLGDKIMEKNPKSDTVFLTYQGGFADALSGATFAARKNAPILYTDSDSLNEDTRNVLKKWGTTNVYILGGEGVIKSSVENELKDMKINCKRLGGDNRYETSKKIVEYFYDDNDCKGLTLACGSNFPDALSGTSIASEENKPIILYDKNVNSPEIKNFIKSKFDKGYVLGADAIMPSKFLEQVYKKEPVKENELSVEIQDSQYSPLSLNIVPVNKDWILKFNHPIDVKDLDFEMLAEQSEEKTKYKWYEGRCVAFQQSPTTIKIINGSYEGKDFYRDSYYNGRYGIVVRKGTKSKEGQVLKEDKTFYFQVRNSTNRWDTPFDEY